MGIARAFYMLRDLHKDSPLNLLYSSIGVKAEINPHYYACPWHRGYNLMQLGVAIYVNLKGEKVFCFCCNEPLLYGSLAVAIYS
jgi:hypothetical protein